MFHMNHNNRDNQNKKAWELKKSLYYEATHHALQHEALFVLIVTVVVIHVQNLDVSV